MTYSSDLMRLKRSVQKSNNPSVRKTGKEKPEALLSRQAPGMSFDFHPKVWFIIKIFDVLKL